VIRKGICARTRVPRRRWGWLLAQEDI
jgi:hypothetical protein